MKRRAGFTLIELMVCVVIAALLATIALPAWRSVMIRAQRDDARTALYALATAQERYRLLHGHYAAAAAPAPPAGLGLGLSAKGWYALRIESADATAFSAAARPAPGSPQGADEQCRVLTLDQAGRRGSAPAAPAVCWR